MRMYTVLIFLYVCYDTYTKAKTKVVLKIALVNSFISTDIKDNA